MPTGQIGNFNVDPATGKISHEFGYERLGDFTIIAGTHLQIFNIPSVYRHLRVIARLRSSLAANENNVRCQINHTDGGAEFYIATLKDYSGAAPLVSAGGSVYLGSCPATNSPISSSDNLIIDFPYYRNDGLIKQLFAQHTHYLPPPLQIMRSWDIRAALAGNAAGLAPITSISLFGALGSHTVTDSNWVPGITTATLYGMA